MGKQKVYRILAASIISGILFVVVLLLNDFALTRHCIDASHPSASFLEWIFDGKVIPDHVDGLSPDWAVTMRSLIVQEGMLGWLMHKESIITQAAMVGMLVGATIACVAENLKSGKMSLDRSIEWTAPRAHAETAVPTSDSPENRIAISFAKSFTITSLICALLTVVLIIVMSNLSHSSTSTGPIL